MRTTSSNSSSSHRRYAPPPQPSHRRRTRSSSGSSSSSSSAASFVLSPSPSLSSSSSSSSIPFSWEQSPGIPKTLTLALPNPVARLPLPPPLRPPPRSSFPRRKKERLSATAAADVDPFAIALAECSKDPPAPESDLTWIGTKSSTDIRPSRRFPLIAGDLLGLLDLYGSCKASCAVAESTIEIPRVGGPRRVG